MTRCLLSLTLVLSVSTSTLAEGPSEDVPELKVLSNYVGTWEATVESEQSPLTKAKHTAKWILDGRYLQQDVTLMTEDGTVAVQSHNLYTYDTNLGKYRTWTFVSDGKAYEATGTWDESARTLTFTNSNNGLSSTTTAHFVEDGVEHWQWTITTAGGDTFFAMSGKSKRQGN